MDQVNYEDDMLSFPLSGLGPVITSPYGWRTHPILGTRKFHNGVDLRAPQGTPIQAPASGTVVSVINNDVCGYGLIVQHEGLRTGYCHLSRIDVKKGAKVRAGQRLGLSGGRKGSPGAGRSTGAHLHWIVYVKKGGKWKHTDPMLHLGEGGTAWPTLAGLFESAKELWEDWWDSPSADPAEPTPKPARASGATTSWRLAPGVPMQVRLVASSGTTYSPGIIPSGTFSVQAFDGQRWVSTGGELRAATGHRYEVAATGGRLRLTDLGR